MNHKVMMFLRWCGRYTNTDMVYWVQGASWLTLTQIFLTFSGLILIYVMANNIDPIILGEYRFLMSGFTLLCITALPGMRTALRESVPKGNTGSLPFAFWTMFRWGLIGSTISIIVSAYYLYNDNVNLSIGFFIISILVPLYNSATAYNEYLIAVKALRLNTVYSVLTRSCSVLFTLIAIYLFPEFAWFILGASLMSTTITNLIFHSKTLKKYYRNNQKIDVNLPSYAKHLSLMTAFGLIAGQFDKILVWKVIGPEALAVFYIAQTIPQNITSSLNAIPTLAFAKFGERDPKITRQTLLPKILKYFFGVTIFSLMYILMAPFIFEWLFPQYLKAIYYSQLLALIPIFSAFLPIKTYLTVIKATKQLYLLSIIPPLVRLVVAVILIGKLGLLGVVYAVLAEALTRSALLLLYFFKT